MKRDDVRAYAMLAFVMLFWGGNAIVGRAVRHEIPPLLLAAGRWGGACLVLAPFAWKPILRDRALLVAHWRIILTLGLVGVAAFNALLYSGLRYTTATNGILLQALIPPLVLAIDFVLFGARASVLQGLGVALSTAGVLWIVFKGDMAALFGLKFGFGDGLILIGVLGWSLYTSLLRRRPPVHPLSLLALTFLIAFLVMVPLAATEWREIAIMPRTAGVAGAFLYVAVLPSVAAYFLYNSAVEQIGAGPASQTMSLMPIVGAGLASVMLHEPLASYHWIGMALICTGIGVTAVTTGGADAPKRLRI